VKRETENIVLLLVGVSVAMIISTGVYTRYVKPGLLPWLAASAAVLIALALTAIVRDIRRGPGRPEEHAHSHDHGAHRGGIGWLLVVPIVMLVFVVPPALSARAAAPVAAPSSDTARRPFPALPAEHAPAVSLPEVLMRIATGSAGGLDGRLISVTGFVMKDAEQVDLAKIVIVCCAADAQLARLQLSGPAAAVAAALPDNTWVQVEGIVPTGQRYSGTSSIPMLEVSRVVPIEAPANSYGA
jgi:uncharacterized repeat protein (TIGR03943 family)